MIDPKLLGALGAIHDLLREVLRETPAAEASRPVNAHLGCLSWQLARAVYRETYWLREIVSGDADLTARVRHLFGDLARGDPAPLDLAVPCAQLPPPEHLLRWAADIQQEHLRRLATPGALPAHPLLAGDRLAWFILQENARAYENLLALCWLRTLSAPAVPYRVTTVLRPSPPSLELFAMDQGHYRIGSRNEPWAYDHELPPQAVALSAFRIARQPVTNAEYLAFMVAGGYQDQTHWDSEGRAWLSAVTPRPQAPLGWRQDAQGAWYELSINGPADSLPGQPVTGISRHEARAIAAWVDSLGGDHAGAVVQHEYQWEIAARSGQIAEVGRAWEWCANAFHPYAGFSPFPEERTSADAFSRVDGVLRGAGLHTQPCLRRASYRWPLLPDIRWAVTGTRLVYPPA